MIWQIVCGIIVVLLFFAIFFPKIPGKYGRKRSRYIPHKVRSNVLKRDCSKCRICGTKLNLQFDHIIPFSKCGPHWIVNVQLLCEKHNKIKSNKLGCRECWMFFWNLVWR